MTLVQAATKSRTKVSFASAEAQTSAMARQPRGAQLLYVSILHGNGNATFAPLVDYVLGAGNDTTPTGVAVGDFNGDLKPDLAVANYDSGNVWILLSNGDGSFAAAVNYTVTGGNLGPDHVVITDLNGDGKSDMVVNGFPGQVHVLLGNGNGTFTPAVGYSTGTGALFLTPIGRGRRQRRRQERRRRRRSRGPGRRPQPGQLPLLRGTGAGLR